MESCTEKLEKHVNNLTAFESYAQILYSETCASAKPGGAVQSWPVLASVIVFIARVHLWSTFIVLSQYS